MSKMRELVRAAIANSTETLADLFLAWSIVSFE
jgi:hypothetical protein